MKSPKFPLLFAASLAACAFREGEPDGSSGTETAAKESETRKITMKDGRVVEFGQKTKMKKDYGWDADKGLEFCRIDFDNSETIEVYVDPTSETGHNACGHGLIQKLGDAAAGAESTADAVEAVAEVAARIQKGEWLKARAEGGGSAKGASELVQALMEVMSKSREEVRATLATISAAEKAALRRVDAIAVVIERLKAEKQPSKADKEKADRGAAVLAKLTGATVAA